MKDQEKVIMALLLKLSAFYPKADIPRPTIEAYVEALSDIPLDLLSAAVERIVRVSKFWPSVAEIREAVQDIFEADCVIWSAEQAWEWVQYQMQYSGEGRRITEENRMADEAVRMMGGFELLGSGNVVDRPWRRKEFIKIYNILLERLRADLRAGPIERKVLAGQPQRTYLEPFDGVRRIAAAEVKRIGDET